MMKKILFAALSLISLQLSAQTWSQLGSLPASYEARNHVCTFSIDGFGYAVAGYSTQSSTYIFKNDVHQYNPATDSWTAMSDFPGTPRGFAYAVENNGKGYLGFGIDTGFIFNDFWEYNPATDSWNQLANCPGLPRRHPAMVSLNNKIYVGCGDGNTGNLSDWWEYDIPSNTWSQKANFPSFPRHHPYFFAINNEAYVGFGHNGNSIYKDLYKYNPTNNTWTTLPSLPAQGRVAGTQFAYGGKGYLLSGQGEDHSNMANGEFWEFDPITNAWTSLPPHPGGSRWAPGSFVINNSVYFTSGEAGSSNLTDMKDLYKFDLPIFNVATRDVKKRNFALYPNPATNEISITNNGTIEEIKVTNMYGVAATTTSIIKGNTALVNTKNLASGLYILHLSAKQETSAAQFTVIR